MGWGGGNFEEPWVRTAIQRHVAKQPSCQPDQIGFKFVGMGENITFERKLMMRGKCDCWMLLPTSSGSDQTRSQKAPLCGISWFLSINRICERIF